MRKLSILLFATVIAFASCSKDDSVEDLANAAANSNFKGSYTINIDGQEINTLIKDVMYISDYNRVEIYGMDAAEQIVTLYVGNIPENNNESADASIDGAVILTYNSVMYSSHDGSGTITRLSSDKISFDNILVKTVLGDDSKTFSGTATIGTTESL